MHVRQQIRDAAVSRLSGLSLTGSRVYQSRIRPVEQSNLPCLLVNTNDEEIGPSTMHGAYGRTLQLVIRCVAQQSGDGLDDLLDSIAEQVEAELGDGTPLLAGKSQQLRLTAMEFVFDGEGERPAGELQLTYSFDYFTTTAAPGTAL